MDDLVERSTRTSGRHQWLMQLAEALTQRLRMSSLQRWFDRSGFQSNRARCSRRPLWMARESGFAISIIGTVCPPRRCSLPNDNRQNRAATIADVRYNFGTTEREKDGALLPKRHQIKHLEFVVS